MFKLTLVILLLAAVAVAGLHYGVFDLGSSMRTGVDYATGKTQIDLRLQAQETLARKRLDRALRGYRAATGRLPENLQELVRDGSLDAAELSDEWGRPLAVERDEGILRVRSAGRDGHFDTEDDWELELAAPGA
jgi:hypothetical protein